MCRNISSGASWSGDRASTGSLIVFPANLIVFTYDMPLLEHAYQTPATLKLFKRFSKSVIHTQQESLSVKWGYPEEEGASSGMS